MILEKTTMPYATLRKAITAHKEHTKNNREDTYVAAGATFEDGSTYEMLDCKVDRGEVANITKISYFKRYQNGAPAGIEIQGNVGDTAIKIRFYRRWDSSGHELFPTAIADTLKNIGLPVKDSYADYGPTEPEVIDGW